jgi:hypothetical protein
MGWTPGRLKGPCAPNSTHLSPSPLSVAIFNLRAIPQADERSPIGTRAPGRQDQGRGSNRRGGTSPGRSANGSGRLEPELPNKSIHRSLSRHGNGSTRLAGPPHRTPSSRFSLFRPFFKWDGAQIRVPASTASEIWDPRSQLYHLVRVFMAAGGDPAEESGREDAARPPDRGVSRRLSRLVHPSLHPALDDYLVICFTLMLTLCCISLPCMSLPMPDDL